MTRAAGFRRIFWTEKSEKLERTAETMRENHFFVFTSGKRIPEGLRFFFYGAGLGVVFAGIFWLAALIP